LQIGGVATPRQSWEYGPAIIEDGGRLHMFYCTIAPNATARGVWDQIAYVYSQDGGANWSTPVTALDAGGQYAQTSVCDPSVVKVGNKYVMYVTCIDTRGRNDGYKNNRVCAATSSRITGPWAMHNKPVFEDKTCSDVDANGDGAPEDYCVGQPSALVANGQVMLYASRRTHAQESNMPVPGSLFLSTSSDGLNFSNGQEVYSKANVDVKRDSKSGKYLMMLGELGSDVIYWNVSDDGINWPAFDPTRAIASKVHGSDWSGSRDNHNPGIASDASGAFNETSWVGYGAADKPGPIECDLFRSDFTLVVP
jgi:hypothetical protein